MTKGMDRSGWQKAFNCIQSKHFDFVICRASDASILLLIELDDKSHQQDDRRDRDAFLDRATKAAGIPLLHVRCRRSYSLQEVSDLLADHLPDRKGPRPKRRGR